MSGVVTRRIGACRDSKACSATMAEISAAAPHVRWAGSATTSRPVLRTEARMPSMSRGTRVRGSKTSTESPSAASASAAAVASTTALEMATTVTSLPSRTVRPTPRGMWYASSETSSFMPHSRQASKMSTGSSESTAERSRPLASLGLAGAMTFSPGTFMNIGYGRSEWCAPVLRP